MISAEKGETKLTFETLNELTLKVTCTGNDILFAKAGAFIAGDNSGKKNYRFEHYKGWDAARTAVFLKAFCINNASTAAEIYQYIVETPGNYLKYYWGYLNFLDLKTVCQKRLGDDFDLKEFHHRILEIGPVQFPVLEKYMK